MATLIVRNPLNPLGPYALALVDTALSTYRKVIRSRNSPRMNRNLAWLERLLLRITAKLAKAPLPDGAVEESDSEDDAELLGWKTRLIERAGQGLRSARTIQPRQQVTPDTVITADLPLRPSSQPAIDSSQAVSGAVSGDGSAFTDDDWVSLRSIGALEIDRAVEFVVERDSHWCNAGWGLGVGLRQALCKSLVSFQV